MRIAFIGARGVIGKYSGIETYYEEVGSRLVAMGHEVTAYCRSYFTPAVSDYRGIRIRRLPTFRGKHTETIVHSLMCTIDASFRSYDIVQFHALGSAPLSLIPRCVGKRTIVSVRGLDGQRAKWGPMARAYLSFGEWASARCPSATNVVSRELQKYFSEKYHATTTYIPNGIDACEHVAPDRIRSFGIGSRDYILYVGRLTPEKDCHSLIEAFRQLRTNVKLVFVGGSTYSDEYVRELRRHEGDRILFLGFQNGQTLAELFSNAYVYVLPSRIEGLSISLLEAMGYGNCVLTSDIPENVELVQGDGVTFRTADVADLTQKLDYLLRHPEIVLDKGRACQERVRRDYGWDRIAEETQTAFKRLLQGAGHGPETKALSPRDRRRSDAHRV